MRSWIVRTMATLCVAMLMFTIDSMTPAAVSASGCKVYTLPANTYPQWAIEPIQVTISGIGTIPMYESITMWTGDSTSACNDINVAFAYYPDITDNLQVALEFN